MYTATLLFLALLPVASLPSPGSASFPGDHRAFAPVPLERPDAPGFLPDNAAAEESEEEWCGGEQPCTLASISPDDGNRFSTSLDSSVSLHPVHSRDRHESPRSPPTHS